MVLAAQLARLVAGLGGPPSPTGALLPAGITAVDVTPVATPAAVEDPMAKSAPDLTIAVVLHARSLRTHLGSLTTGKRHDGLTSNVGVRKCRLGGSGVLTRVPFSFGVRNRVVLPLLRFLARGYADTKTVRNTRVSEAIH